MMRKSLLQLLTLFLVLACSKKNETTVTAHINKNWTFTATDTLPWLAANVPGTVHSNLFDAKVIPDPFVRNNELDLQWISEKNWHYKTTFTVPDNILNKQYITLNFNGLDTYANVYLNDTLVLQANNAFRRWRIPVKNLLKPSNTLEIIFNNPHDIEEKAAKNLYYTLPEGNRVFTRKPQFHYGWDWGPTYITSGIWRPVYLEAWNHLKVQDVYLMQEKITQEQALLNAKITLNASQEKKVQVAILVNNKKVSEYSLSVVKGKATYNLPFTIKNPQWWWTHNLGEPYLYDITIKIFDKASLYYNKTIKKGLKTIELVTQEEAGKKTFYFKLNGIPVFMKGANYIPQNSFQDKVTPEHYNKLLNDVVAANMNMLRVWGGGIYEDELFYELCDEKGILVWQDFMFACAMYPGDEKFLENVTQEAIDNVKRLRNYTSIALWCGNNENAEGWANWGWQAGKSNEQKQRIWGHYKKVFKNILPEVVKTHAENIPYWESSPKFGRGDKRYLTEGDAHDWWVWHDAYPFEHFEENVPLFMSEFGFQAFPSLETIQYATQTDSLVLNGPYFKTHQKHSRGFSLIREYMERDFPIPSNNEDYVYVSQLLQAYGITKGIEAHRRAKPRCMGSLYWQLNDCWPAVSWSSIDYLGNWKALHYKVKDAFKNVLVSPYINKDTLEVHAINDNLFAVNNPITIKLIDFYGNETLLTTITDSLPANSAQVVFKKKLSNVVKNTNLKALLIAYDNTYRVFYLTKPKHLALPEQQIVKQVKKVNDGFEITLQANTLQKDVFLHSNVKGHFNNNFFDLLPNKPIKVIFKTQAKEAEFSIKTLNAIMHQEDSFK